MAPEPQPGRFRWRLTITFFLLSGLSAGALAVSSFLMVRDARLDNFLERALNDSEINHIAASSLASDDRSGLRSLMNRVERRGAQTIARTPHGTQSSAASFTPDDIPQDDWIVTDGPAPMMHQNTVVDGAPYLVVSTPEIDPGTQLYFFYPRSSLEQGLADLAGILLRVWAVVVAASALVGNILARRTLRPVARASDAARSLAEGLLDTRLPVESQDEFGAWAASFNEMADALQEKIQQLSLARERESRFTSDVSHELRTPLTALMGSASMLDERLDEMSPDARWAAERVIKETRRLRSLVDELLEISRLQQGHESLDVEPVDLAALVDSVISSRQWKHVTKVYRDSVVVPTDRRRVERIVANLVSNAVTHGRVGTAVKVGSSDGRAFVEVMDQGDGVPPEHVEHLFERFYKVDPSRGGGSGLGLSIAAENARLLGGSIELDNEVGRGCRFTLRLPTAIPSHIESAVSGKPV